MNRLSKTQLNLLDFALDQLYSHLKMKYNVDYDGNNRFTVYGDIIHFRQCSIPPGIAWYADIVLKERKIYFTIRKVERETIRSKFDYDLFYMNSNYTTHSLHF